MVRRVDQLRGLRRSGGFVIVMGLFESQDA